MSVEVDYIFNRAHWRLEPLPDFVDFTKNLGLLVPEGSVLCLAQGRWDSELKEFFARNALPAPEALKPPGEFIGGKHISVIPAIMDELAKIAENHAEPEIALHLSVSARGEQILEWFDAPCDPISVALQIPEHRVRAFCDRLQIRYEEIGGPTSG